MTLHLDDDDPIKTVEKTPLNTLADNSLPQNNQEDGRAATSALPAAQKPKEGIEIVQHFLRRHL